MLQSMRDGAGKWIIWIVIIVVIAALTLWGISYYFIGGSSATPPVAKVNGVKITQAEFSAAYNRLRQSQPKLFTAPAPVKKIKQQFCKILLHVWFYHRRRVAQDLPLVMRSLMPS